VRTTKGKGVAILAVMLIAAASYVMGAGASLLAPTASATPILFSEDAVTSVYDNVSPAVVEIKVVEQGSSFRGRFLQQGQGSGFLIGANGDILTNNHVVDGATSVQVVLKGGKTVDATVVGKDPLDDLALVRVDPSAVAGITPLQFADSGSVRPGQMAIALGSPYGLDGSITVGVVSGLNRSVGGSRLTGMIQTDAAMNPGNSGGPLLSSSGQVIGINTAIESEPGARGIGFAVPSNVAKRVLPDLIAGRQIARPWLGISGVGLTQAQAQGLGLSVDKGVYVVSVLPGSPAAGAGLKGGGTGASGELAAGGDVITAVDGKAVASVTDLSGYFDTKKVGDSVTLTVLRTGQSLSVAVTLGARPDTISTAPTPRQGSGHPGVPRD